jgi:tRNA G18 (ribose-2'-O)-methylase SpoU
MSEPETYFQMRQCGNESCRFRFPVAVGSELGQKCAYCGGETAVVTPPFTNQTPPPLTASPTTKLSVLVDNVRSIYNVGSFFRTADGAGGIAHLYLCGMSPTPANPKVAKTALGAEASVPGSYHNIGWETAVSLHKQGHQLWDLEGTTEARSLLETAVSTTPIVLIVGNELSGIDPAILEICDKVLAIPMQGTKSSLNVASALAVALYWLHYAKRDKA